MRNQLIGLSIFFAAISFSSSASALENDTRYDIFKEDGEFFVFDKVTGQTTPLREHRRKMAEQAARGVENLPTIKVEPPVKSPRDIKVLAPQKSTSTPPPPRPKDIEIDTSDADEVVIKPGKTQVTAPPVRETKAPPVSTDAANGTITDEMRKRAFTEVSAYRSNLGLIQTVQIQGGRIKGTIAVTNKGKKKLETLELTLFVPLGDGLQFEEHHFLFGYKAGLKPPPAPNVEDPDSADPQIMIVDFPAPAGGGKSKVDLKVSYLKFSEE